MKLINYTAMACLTLCSCHVFGQTSFTNGVNSLEISGVITAIYKYRFLDSSNPDNHVGNNISNPLNRKKNVFNLNNARLNIQGTKGTRWSYRVQADLAQLGFSSASGEFPAIADGWIAYKAMTGLRITLGYHKLPYSANSNASLETQPYWQRAEITRGGIFSRRDVGLTIKKSFLGERINLFAGVYSGMGEYILTSTSGGDNDANGKPEFIGRLELSTSKLNYNDIYDVHKTQSPLFNIGINGRYAERTKSLPGLADYDLKIVNGTKKTIGADAAFAFMGVSAQFEIHQLIITPKGNDTIRLQGKNTSHFNAGGLLAQLNYYQRKYKSGIYVRYDNLIPNDLIQNNKEQTLSFGYNYFMSGSKSMLKIQYMDRLDKKNLTLLRQSDEIRIGWQLVF